MPCETLPLPVFTPGAARTQTICRFGRAGRGGKAYVQAAAHADEIPAALCAQHLRALLEEAEEQGRVRGEIVLVPAASPEGLAQFALDHHMGRHHLPSGRNFNRFWPDATEEVMARRGRFGGDPAANARMVREIVREALRGRAAHAEDEVRKLALMRLAHDADIVLDLHADLDAEQHLFLDPDCWPALSVLAGLLDAKVVMLARHSGGAPFEETIAAPFIALREAGVPCDLPETVTVELRGRQDVSDELAERDARALFGFLVLRGLIAGEVSAPPFTGVAAPFEATELVRAPAGGILVYRREKGADLKPGETLAEIVDPLTMARTPARTAAGGRLFSRNLHHFVRRGEIIAKVQGASPLADRERGRLMTD